MNENLLDASPRSVMSNKEFEKRKYLLQVELLKFQNHIRKNNEKVIIVFEGVDCAGKSGTAKKFIEFLNPRFAKIISLDKPTEKEKRQWYWTRFIQEFPKEGEIAIFDRSWYNRSGVEQVLGFATIQQVNEFYRECPVLESLWKEAGFQIIKFWFSITKEEQARRFREREEHPLKIGKLSDIDILSHHKWQEYADAKEKTFAKTQDWIVVDSMCKRSARIASMQYVLLNNDYEGKDLNNIGEIDLNILEKK
jgi:polyphosphate kinase 2